MAKVVGYDYGEEHGMATAYHLMKKIAKWHHDRNLIEGSDDKSQFAKLIQEAGELSDNICKGNGRGCRNRSIVCDKPYL